MLLCRVFLRSGGYVDVLGVPRCGEDACEHCWACLAHESEDECTSDVGHRWVVNEAATPERAQELLAQQQQERVH